MNADLTHFERDRNIATLAQVRRSMTARDTRTVLRQLVARATLYLLQGGTTAFVRA